MIHDEWVDDPEEVDDNDDDDEDEFLGFYAERRRQKYMLNVKRRHIRDISNPFDVTRETFMESYRFHQDLFFSLVDLLTPHMYETVSDLALPIELKASRRPFPCDLCLVP